MIDTAVKAAEGAAEIIMEYFGRKKKISHKGEIDLVTEADVKAEEYIVEKIKEKFPAHGFILEEQNDEKEDSEYVWIIDPIDGTTSFAHNYPMFCISIALYRNKEPLLGVVYAPYMDEMFTAQKGKGAYLNGNKIKVSGIDDMKNALVSTGFPYTRLSSDKDNLDYFNKVAKHAGGLRRSGSAALDISYVAAGRVDAYWEIGLKIMDSAAALVILDEAGGKYSDLSGNPLQNYEKILATNSHIHKKMIDILED